MSLKSGCESRERVADGVKLSAWQDHSVEYASEEDDDEKLKREMKLCFNLHYTWIGILTGCHR